MDNDDVLYGYGVGYFSTIPEGADVLVQMDGDREPTEGFVQANNADQIASSEAYLNDSVQGIAYEGADVNGNDIDVVLFANTLTNKVHQRDEYAYISNFIYENMLGDEYEAEIETYNRFLPVRRMYTGRTTMPTTPVSAGDKLPAVPAAPAVYN